jgi:hypothetical protein
MSTLEDFCAIVRELAYYKINIYQPYIEDVFQFSGAPQIGAGGAVLTASELRQIVEEGRKYHVTVIPIFQTLGHQTRLLSAAPFRRFAELPPDAGVLHTLAGALRRAHLIRETSGDEPPSTPPFSFAAANPATLKFVTSLIDEIASAAPTSFFHIGGDEASDIGAGASRGLAARIGIGEVYARYVAALARHLRENHGQRAIVYGDMILRHRMAMPSAPRDVIVMVWRYDPDCRMTSLGLLKKAGFRSLLASAGIWSWTSFYPNYERAFRNIASVARAARREGIMGMVTAAWGDGGAENLRENNWEGYAYGAAVAWGDTADAPRRFLRRFIGSRFGLDSEALARVDSLLGWQEFDHVGWYGQLYHRTPRVRQMAPERLERIRVLGEDMNEALELIRSEAPRVRFHHEHLASWEHTARRFLYVSRRECLMDSLARAPASTRLGVGRGTFLPSLEALRDEATAIKADYARLWLRSNRASGLESNLARLEKQRVALNGVIDGVRRGNTVPAARKAVDAYEHGHAADADIPCEVPNQD